MPRELQGAEAEGGLLWPREAPHRPECPEGGRLPREGRETQGEDQGYLSSFPEDSYA